MAQICFQPKEPSLPLFPPDLGLGPSMLGGKKSPVFRAAPRKKVLGKKTKAPRKTMILCLGKPSPVLGLTSRLIQRGENIHPKHGPEIIKKFTRNRMEENLRKIFHPGKF